MKLAEEDKLELQPLWVEPSPMGHNGGPQLEPRKPGRPAISTPELRDRILELLYDGVPLRVICRTKGMPARQTVYGWRKANPDFDRLCWYAQQEGYVHLAELVSEEVHRMLDEKRPLLLVRFVFNLRRKQLARMNPWFFGCKDMKC